LSQYTRVTDGQTDRQTDGQTEFSSLYRVCITCSAVKMGQKGAWPRSRDLFYNYNSPNGAVTLG